MTLAILNMLVSYEFYSKIGFLISYAVTSLLVLEVLRLVYTDVNKREVERMLDTYSACRNGSPPRRRRIPIDELDKRPHTPSPRRQSPAATPDSDRTLINEERRRRRRAASLAARQLQQPVTVTVTHGQAHIANAPVRPRQLRKRSETSPTSAGSTEPWKPERRRREGSPASVVSSSSKGSLASEGPKGLRRMRDKEAQLTSSSLHKMLRQRA